VIPDHLHCHFQLSINDHVTTHPHLTSLHLFLSMDDKDDILRRCKPHTHSDEFHLRQQDMKIPLQNHQLSFQVPQTSSASTKGIKRIITKGDNRSCTATLTFKKSKAQRNHVAYKDPPKSIPNTNSSYCRPLPAAAAVPSASNSVAQARIQSQRHQFPHTDLSRLEPRM